MSTTPIPVKASLRTVVGSAGVRRIRRQGFLPGVIYGGKTLRNIQLNEHEFGLLLSRHHSEYLLLDIEIEGSDKATVLLKDVQHKPMSSEIIHCDFQEVSMDHPIHVRVTLRFIGTPVGVTTGGGMLDIHLRSVDVHCLPGDLVEEFDVDISALDLGGHLTIGSLPIDRSKYTPKLADDVSVASVIESRVVAEETPAEGAAPAAAAPAAKGAPAKAAPAKPAPAKK